MSQEAGLDKVVAEDVTQLLDSQLQHHSIEDLEDMVKELSQQKKEQKEKEEQPPLKCMKTSDLQHSFSAMENLTDELWHWLWQGAKCESKKSVMVPICPHSETHKERIRNLDSQHFIFFYLKKKGPQPGISTEKSTLCIIPQSKNINARALQWQLQKFSVWASNISQYE